MESMSDWSSLPLELLVKVAINLTVVRDFMVFRGICTWWRSAATKDKFIYSKVPLLLTDECGRDDRELYSFSDRKISTTVSLPEAKGKICVEARFGWILAIESRGYESRGITLFKPFCPKRFHLPKTKSESKNFRVILSADPSETSSFVVVVLMSNHSLMFWKNGNEKWTQTKTKRWLSNIGYFNGKIYGIDSHQDIWSWDPSGSDLTLANLVLHVDEDMLRNGKTSYLVESSDGELLVIVRDEVENRVYGVPMEYDFETVGFRVYRVDVERGECEEIHCLGKDAVFVGDNATVCVAADDFPGVVRSNCIYFTDDCVDSYNRGRDMGMYDVEDKSFERFNFKSVCPKCPPMWIILSI